MLSRLYLTTVFNYILLISISLVVSRLRHNSGAKLIIASENVIFPRFKYFHPTFPTDGYVNKIPNARWRFSKSPRRSSERNFAVLARRSDYAGGRPRAYRNGARARASFSTLIFLMSHQTLRANSFSREKQRQ